MASRARDQNGGQPAAQIVRGEAVVDLAAADRRSPISCGHSATKPDIGRTGRHPARRGRLRGVADAQVLHPDDVRQR